MTSDIARLTYRLDDGTKRTIWVSVESPNQYRRLADDGAEMQEIVVLDDADVVFALPAHMNWMRGVLEMS